jgi:hypothetical protein
MQIPRVRFTVRRLMIVVASVALAIVVAVRSHRMRELADYHWGQLSLQSVLAPLGSGGAMVTLIADKCRWHEAMALKCERAARYPWLRVASGPPDPIPPPAPG